MAVTTINSTQYANQTTTPVTKQPPCDLHGRKRVAIFECVQSGVGDANSLLLLAKLPAGTVRVLGGVFACDAFGASRVLTIGHQGYTGLDGVAVAASQAAFIAAFSVASALTDTYKKAGGAAAAGVKIESRDGFVVSAQVTGGTIPDTTKVNGWIEYAQD